MIVISTLLNSCVVVLTNSPKAVNRWAWASCCLSSFDLLLQTLGLAMIACGHHSLPTT